MKIFTPLALTITSALLFAACSASVEPSTRPPKGNAQARVVVKEFADLQCPACRAVHSELTPAILELHGDDIRFEFMHFPLSTIHPYALSAAIASECAADQGKFWEFVDLNYQKQPELSVEALTEWGRLLGLDMDAYNTCRKSSAKRKLVLAEYKEGRELDVQGTPTFFVNGQKVSTDALMGAIEEAKISAAPRL